MKKKVASKKKAGPARVLIGPKSFLRVKPHVMSRHHLDEKHSSISILCLRRKVSYLAEGAAGYLWLLLDGTRSLEEAVRSCQADLKIKEKSFPAQAALIVRQFFDENLVDQLNRPAAQPLFDIKAMREVFKIPKAQTGTMRFKRVELIRVAGGFASEFDSTFSTAITYFCC